MDCSRTESRVAKPLLLSATKTEATTPFFFFYFYERKEKTIPPGGGLCILFFLWLYVCVAKVS
jgi:hypothetical protein